MTVEGIESKDIEPDEVRSQLDRLLVDSHFAQSRRYPSFLRYVVNESLEGRDDQIKERTLGVEVFGRDPSYDTTADPIVRVAAAEIRKRIAQYYQEHGHEAELRILLPIGSYVPKFERPHIFAASTDPTSHGLAGAVPAPAPVNGIGVNSGQVRLRFWIWSALALSILAAVSYELMLLYSAQSAIARFWNPLLSAKAPILICLPSQNQLSSVYVRNAEDLSKQSLTTRDQGLGAVAMGDMETLINISDLVRKAGNTISYKDEGATSLTDLRKGPTIFLGAYDNTWTLRLTRTMRFRFDNDAEMKHFWIEDCRTQKRWGDQETQHRMVDSYTDYAIVARLRNPETGQYALVAAGLTQGATIGAGEFITQPAFVDLLQAAGPKDWYKKRTEVVISTDIIGGRPAPPKIVAAEFW